MHGSVQITIEDTVSGLSFSDRNHIPVGSYFKVYVTSNYMYTTLPYGQQHTTINYCLRSHTVVTYSKKSYNHQTGACLGFAVCVFIAVSAVVYSGSHDMCASLVMILRDSASPSSRHDTVVTAAPSAHAPRERPPRVDRLATQRP